MKGVSMSSQPMSANTSELSSSCGRVMYKISAAPQGRPGHPSAMFLIDQAAWKAGRLVPVRDLRDDDIGKRIALISRESALTKLEEVDWELHHAQDNFATVFQASPAILCIIQLDGLRYREINKVYEKRTGYRRCEVIGKTSLGLGLWDDANDRKRTIQKLIAKGHLHGHQVVFRTKKGARLTTLLSAEIMEFGGETCALIIAEDISKRRQAEEARMDLAQSLINAQEAECTRVARELHDNIGQSLAMFGMELHKTRLALTGLSRENDARFARLSVRLRTLGQEVGNLSHQLHSPELELLGFEAAVKGQCREFSELYQVPVHCECSGVPVTLSSDISLCLFRVMQEALHNIAKHSHATTIKLELCGTPKLLRLVISDDGVGFTASRAKGTRGLGLISMRERLYLVGGKFVIVSKPGSGTRVEATVPFLLRRTKAASTTRIRIGGPSAAKAIKGRP
jgi:PAS domain S-box-containing protein